MRDGHLRKSKYDESKIISFDKWEIMNGNMFWDIETSLYVNEIPSLQLKYEY